MFRSMLFVPANNAHRVQKALSLGADAVILDLEDAVAASEKVSARAALAKSIPSVRRAAIFVRINGFATAHFAPDLEAAIHAGANGIILPKVETRDEIVITDWLAAQHERQAGRSARDVQLVPHFETAAGVARATEILTASRRLCFAGFGGGDFTTDLNLSPSRDERELMPYRAAIVLASRQAGLAPPVDSVWADLKDIEGLREVAAAARRAGFQGKRCIHPDQIEVINQIFSPSASEVEWARRVVAAFDAAEAQGTSAVRVGDDFVDYPVAQRARHILALGDRVLARLESRTQP